MRRVIEKSHHRALWIAQGRDGVQLHWTLETTSIANGGMTPTIISISARQTGYGSRQRSYALEQQAEKCHRGILGLAQKLPTFLGDAPLHAAVRHTGIGIVSTMPTIHDPRVHNGELLYVEVPTEVCACLNSKCTLPQASQQSCYIPILWLKNHSVASKTHTIKNKLFDSPQQHAKG